MFWTVLLMLVLPCPGLKDGYSCAFDTVSQTCTVAGPGLAMTFPAPTRRLHTSTIVYRDVTRHIRLRVKCSPLI